MDPRGEDISRSFQESVLRLIKRMATGQGIGLASLPLENAQASGGVSGAPGGEAPRPVGELTFRCVRVVEGDGGTVGGMRGLVWEASNTTEGNISLSETDIMGPGDVAISVDSPVVEPGQTAHIYIVRGHHA